ncbi:GTP-binding protein [Campylobacter fetus subsp. testudinum]|uniref:dynamin family protein n=1 Tax=Campylobacter fetus TaxID=196 RepID=UPI000818A75B|nr:dynamin family protein [Campylobacter fetus]MPB73066.1 GTP-binding protein [Campylobacter fetus]MPB76750.1 GTP-binding protein [Campylobacter fetus]OCR94992.1 GTP-binding protein [Campylobacter fetus subsp. testudinum]OCR96532.1 GTP-binding protein [Campylobacter fetus subsp. testudinum]OCS00296.1 GTP-binding protein [Campylobacter fetus subsp. testudinum]
MSDFLSQIWGISKLYIKNDYKRVVSSDEAAILLCVSPKNYDRYLTIFSFKEIFKRLELDLNEYSVQLMQIGVLNAIASLEIDFDSTKNALEELAKNDIISFSDFNRIIQFLNSLNLAKKVSLDKQGSAFHKNLETLNEICLGLKKYGYKELEKRINLAYDSANNSKFYLAVTGVINAGKSSTLNALMKKQLLGASNIPETANLSIITYSKDEFAEVVFWSEDELLKMGLEPKNLTSKKVDLNELKNYTTAANEISRYVKEVILGIDLDILKDGINIVDTPGLDDAVVLREELTKAYMQESDFTLHLMNASQSATKKDMSFIVNTLKNGKSGGLIIVLTHIDKLSKNDLKEVLNYTKNSIKTELSEYGFSEELARDTQYFMVSAVKNEGIDELKNYLYESFFGSNSKKATLIIDNYKKELTHIINFITKDLKYLNSVINGDSKELGQKLALLENELEKLNSNLNEISSELDNLNKNLDYSNLNEFSTLKSISSRLKDRILSDVKYANSKKQKVDFDRTSVILESGFRDMFIDFFRDFKHKISKDIESSYEILKLKLNTKDEVINLPNIKEYLDANMPKISYEELKTQVKDSIKNSQNIETLGFTLIKLFDDFIAGLNLKNELNRLSSLCTNEFISSVERQTTQMKTALELKKSELQSFIGETMQESSAKELFKKDVEEKLLNLEEIYNRIIAC